MSRFHFHISLCSATRATHRLDVTAERLAASVRALLSCIQMRRSLLGTNLLSIRCMIVPDSLAVPVEKGKGSRRCVWGAHRRGSDTV